MPNTTDFAIMFLPIEGLFAEVLREPGIMETLRSKEMKDIQKRHLENNFQGLLCEGCDQTVKDESVLVYKSNPKRVVGMSNSSLYVFKS